ncbi:tyrosinase-like protein 1 [Mercenaria mercenaria]|uniref:tyrosinase-like protein 1 n=1 Tax=Mercenaria mercenaria TaxID=6596 RepID=UPI00234F7CFE|nr:tyrosinase-like protein 1 [Mercenaria mercenaria]
MTPVPKMLSLLTLILGLTWSVLPGGNCQIIDADMPVEIIECVQLLSNTTGDVSKRNDIHDDVYNQCLRQFVWKDQHVDWSNFNITAADKEFINSLIGSLVSRSRQKRRVHLNDSPRRLRIRREYRTLPDKDRFAFHRALNTMKKTGQYDVFAKLHTGSVVLTAHTGPALFAWHRIYIFLFEEAMCRIIPWLSLPYWDTTLDDNMYDPADSIIWTKNFLGNGDGHVRVGSFARWMSPGGPLTRNIGGRSRLISRDVVRRVLSRCRTRDISYPTAKKGYDFEKYHGGPHLWVGGHMSGMNTAAFDPAFFLYHAFIDYIFELFRIRQSTFCGVDPAMDYPPTKGLHAAKRPMDRFPQYRNKDGYSNYWTKFMYRYEHSPTCSMWQPFCGSPYLRCDMSRQICVSMGRKKSAHMVCTRRARAEELSIYYGIIFRAPPSEPRTCALRSAFTSRKRRAVNQNMASSLGDQDFTKLSMPVPLSKKLLPIPDYHETSATLKNNFEINGHADVTKWVFIPVNVTYKRNQGSQVSTFRNKKTCVKDPAGAMKVGIQSSGLNYDGDYFGYALIDRHLPVDSSTTFIGIKSPEVQYTEVILSAVHSCGTMCQAYCLIPESEPAAFKPCFGVLKISNYDLNVYGRTYEEAVSRFMLGGVASGGMQNKTLRMFFDCSDSGNSQ